MRRHIKKTDPNRREFLQASRSGRRDDRPWQRRRRRRGHSDERRGNPHAARSGGRARWSR